MGRLNHWLLCKCLIAHQHHCKLPVRLGAKGGQVISGVLAWGGLWLDL